MTSILNKLNLKNNGDQKKWYVYLLECFDKSIYTGITTDIDRRIKQHNTGKIRGLLCRDCNVSLGLMKDNPDRLRKAAMYLEEEYVIQYVIQ